MHQRVVRWEGDVTCLHQLDNLVLLAVVLQLQALGVKLKGGVGVVVQLQVHLVAHASIDAQVDFLVKVEGRGLTVADRQRGVLNVLDCGANL